MAMQNNHKEILILARNTPLEAMRVAAGLTIVGHNIELIFMHRAITKEEAESDQGELLELCDIVPMTTLENMKDHFDLIDPSALAQKLLKSDIVINL